jgi:hypothetical protein
LKILEKKVLDEQLRKDGGRERTIGEKKEPDFSVAETVEIEVEGGSKDLHQIGRHAENLIH